MRFIAHVIFVSSVVLALNSILFDSRKYPDLSEQLFASQPIGVKYKVVYSNVSIDLEREVNFLIGKGWQPVGGMEVARSDNRDEKPWFYQSMILVREPLDNPAELEYASEHSSKE